MKWTFPDGTVTNNSAELKRLCRERGLDWSYFRRREQRGLARRKEGPRAMRLPDDWRGRLDAIFGPEAVHEYTRKIPVARPAIAVVTNATDTKWWHHLARGSAIICGVRSRINYVDVTTDIQLRGNPRGTIIHLFADDAADVERFRSALQPFGWIGSLDHVALSGKRCRPPTSLEIAMPDNIARPINANEGNQLAHLAAEINAAHEQARQCFHRGFEHARRAGSLLIEAKTKVPHGTWKVWLKDNFPASERSAQAYMRAAREFPKLEPEKAQRVADLSLRDALAEMSRDVGKVGRMKPDTADSVLALAEDEHYPLKNAVGCVNRIERHKRIHEAARARQREGVPLSATLLGDPSGSSMFNGQEAEIWRGENHSWTVALLANENALCLPERIEEMKADPDYVTGQDEIAALFGEADAADAEIEELNKAIGKLTRKAKLLRDEGKEKKCVARRIIREKLDELAGPSYAAETHTFRIDDPDFENELEALAEPVEIATALINEIQAAQPRAAHSRFTSYAAGIEAFVANKPMGFTEGPDGRSLISIVAFTQPEAFWERRPRLDTPIPDIEATLETAANG